MIIMDLDYNLLSPHDNVYVIYIYRCTDVRPYSTYHLISFHCCFYSQASETLRNPFEVSCVFNCTQEDGRVRRKITMTKGF